MSLVTTTNSSFTISEDENLLDALERTGHEIEYQCREGYCGSCRLKVVRGKVEYKSLPLAFVMPNEILPCCCSVTENITLECTQTKFDESTQADLFSGQGDLFHDKK